MIAGRVRIFFIFPFLCLPDWSFSTGLIIASLVVGVIVYIVSVVVLCSQLSANMSVKDVLICAVMQACFSFAIGTVVALVAAFIIAILGGALGSAKKKK